METSQNVRSSASGSTVQAVSQRCPLEKAQSRRHWTAFGMQELVGLPFSASSEPSTSWHFDKEVVPWFSGLTPLASTATHINGLRSLSREGVFWSTHNKWKRLYLTRCGVEITLVEDVPESGGQNCIWSAGVVMARYLENPVISNTVRGKRVLELGAGCGLTSMVASLVGGDVYSTEQDSCMPYLEYNLSLNQLVSKVSVRRLHWTDDYSGQLFNLILGCDITYDIKMIDAIFATLSLCLEPDGTCFICHDNDSCPLSAEAFSKILTVAAATGFSVTEEDYKELIEPSFYGPKVQMWRIIRK